MRTATIRDLRTRVPAVRRIVEQDGEVVVTDHGKPVIVLRAYEPSTPAAGAPVDYYRRLRARMPKPLTAAQRAALENADRGER